MGAPSPARFFRFGGFQLDLRARELRRNGVKIRVPDQSIQVLAMLVEHPGELVTREELHNRLWPNGTIVEFDHSINAAIKRLRQALEDSVEAPRYIETLPRFGYRFIGVIEQEPAEDTVPSDEPGVGPSGLAGQIVSHYRILERLGGGGMGEVYRARDTKLGRDVALKVLPEAFAMDIERMARFEREAQVLASLNHPNIATIHGLEEKNGVRALVMELVEGPTLAERIAGRAMPMEEARPIATQIAEALEYAHEKGVIHRDLKPANVALTADGDVKVLDFGLAKALEQPAQPGNPSVSPTLTVEGTRAGVILGTAAYMAPEQARGAAADKRSDIWAFGVVLYEMLTGKQPFAGATVSDTLAAVLKTAPDLDAVPTSMRQLVRRCLEKEARQRLRDIGDARIALNEMSTVDILPQVVLKRAALWRSAAAMVTLIAVIGLVGWWRAAQPVSYPMMRFSLDLGPDGALAEGAMPILSPDGMRVVYNGRDPNGKSLLYTRRLSQEHSFPLPGTEDAISAFFAPDGQSIGFFAGGKMKKTSLDGGTVVVLCDAPQGRGGSWADDGMIVAALRFEKGLVSIPSGGGPVVPVTELKQDARHRWPQVLPGAKGVLFTASTVAGGYEAADIEVQSLLENKRTMLVHGGYYGRYVPSGHLIYVHQGTMYAAPMDINRLELTGPAVPVLEDVTMGPSGGWAAADFSQNGTMVYVRGKVVKQTLVWLDDAGHTQPLREPATEYSGILRFSPDGKRLALGVADGINTNLWVYERERDTMTRLTFTPGYNGSPVWSPDGKHIVFASEGHGRALNLYWIRADGAGEAVRLTESMNRQFPFSFSPDGKRLAFSETSPQTDGSLWILPVERLESDHPSVGKPEPFIQTPFWEGTPMISPDGRWLAYTSQESGGFEIYVRQFPSPRGKWRISTGGGSAPLWSPHQRELFYRSRGGMMVVSYTAIGEEFAATKPRLWAAKNDLGFFDLAPDGKRFAVMQTETTKQNGAAQLTFLLNFFDELRRRAPVGRK